jgi:hypothetical protein
MAIPSQERKMGIKDERINRISQEVVVWFGDLLDEYLREKGMTPQ